MKKIAETQLPFNEFRWADISVADVAGAKEFYAELFGWHYGDIKHEGRTVYSHAFLTSDVRQEQPVAGIAPQWDGQSENIVDAWHPHLLVESVADTLDRIPGAGGTVVMPQMDILDKGSMAIVRDSVGSSMVLWEPFSDAGAGVMKRPGSIAWFELITDRAEQACDFYQSVFGWHSQKVAKDGVDYWMLSHAAQLVCGMQTESSPTEGVFLWLIYFCVTDIDECLARVTKMGGRAIYGPHHEPAIGAYAVVQDSQGMSFGMVEFNN